MNNDIFLVYFLVLVIADNLWLKELYKYLIWKLTVVGSPPIHTVLQFEIPTN